MVLILPIVAQAEPLKNERTKMPMTTSWSDYLLCQLSAAKKLSTLETFPAELLELIVEEVSLLARIP